MTWFLGYPPPPTLQNETEVFHLRPENIHLIPNYRLYMNSFWWLWKEVWTLPKAFLLISTSAIKQTNKQSTKKTTSLTMQLYKQHRRLKWSLLFPSLFFLYFYHSLQWNYSSCGKYCSGMDLQYILHFDIHKYTFPSKLKTFIAVWLAVRDTFSGRNTPYIWLAFPLLTFVCN